MKFACDSCGAQYMISDEKVGDKGVKVRCKKCTHIIVVKPEAPEPPPEEQPGAFDAVFGQDPFGGATETMTQGQLDSLRAEAGAPTAPEAPAAEPPAAEAGAPAGNEDALFGQYPFGEPPAEQPSTPSEETGAPAPEAPADENREWYVAIDDNQVGPISLSEVAQKWDNIEINEETLSWKAGLADWKALADIPELAHLITERPQEKAPAEQGFGTPAVKSGASGRAAAAPGEVTWKPSAASALSSLVEDELVAEEPVAPAASAPTDLPNMPGLSADSLFGGDAASPVAPTPQMPDAPAEPFAAGPSPAAWAPKSGGGGGKMVVALLGVIVVLLLGGGAFVFANQAGLFGGGAAEEVAEKPETDESAPEAKKKPTKVARAKSTKKPETPVRTDSGRTDRRGGGTKASRGGGSKSSNRNRGRSGGGGKTTASKPPAAAAAPAKERLKLDDIVAGVRSNGRTVGPCLKAARSRGEIVPNQYKFILDWQIRPNGSVTNAQLKGPSSVMNTSLPKCFASVMKTWKFPSSREGAPVRNFPFGPVTVR